MLARLIMQVVAFQYFPVEQACGADPVQDCLDTWEARKSHFRGLLVIWCLLSLPYWACAAYAAYYCHELYLQLRIQGLAVRRGRADGDSPDARLATVSWAEDLDATAE